MRSTTVIFFNVSRKTFHKFPTSLSQIAKSFPGFQPTASSSYKTNVVRAVAIRLDKIVAHLWMITATRSVTMIGYHHEETHCDTLSGPAHLQTRWPRGDLRSETFTTKEDTEREKRDGCTRAIFARAQRSHPSSSSSRCRVTSP